MGIHWSKKQKQTSVSSKSLWQKSCRLDFSDGFLWRISEALDSEIFRSKLDQCEWASSWRMQPAVGVLKSRRSQTPLGLSWRMGVKDPARLISDKVTLALTCSLTVVPAAAVLHKWQLHSRNLLFYSRLHCTHSHDNRQLQNKWPVAAEEQWTDLRGKTHSWTEKDWEKMTR